MEYETLKNYERYWRANRSMEQRILGMFTEETNISPRAGDGSQRGGFCAGRSADARLCGDQLKRPDDAV